MSCKRKHKDLSLSQKLDIVELASEKEPQTEISQQFGCSQSTVSKIISQKEELKHEASEINEDPLPAPKSRDVILALCTLRTFMEQHTADFSTFYKMETQMQKLITSKAKQHSIRVPYHKFCYTAV